MLKVIVTLDRLKTMGVKLAVDDFGTGYSSLELSQTVPIDLLKIDRAFVSDITTNKVDADIVTTIIALSHSLNVKVIAEGVETEEQKALLAREGCDSAGVICLAGRYRQMSLSVNFCIENFSKAELVEAVEERTSATKALRLRPQNISMSCCRIHLCKGELSVRRC